MPVCKEGPSGTGSAEDLCSGPGLIWGVFPLVWPYSARTCLEHCLLPLCQPFWGPCCSCEYAGVIPPQVSPSASSLRWDGLRLALAAGVLALGRVPGCTRPAGPRVGWPHHLPLPSCHCFPPNSTSVMFSNKNFFHSVGP